MAGGRLCPVCALGARRDRSQREGKALPTLIKEPGFISDVCECTPVVWQGRLLLMECIRPASGGDASDHYITFRGVETGETLASFGRGYSLACAFAHGETMYVYASRHGDGSWNDVTCFRSRDLISWQSHVVVEQDGDEHLFNSSVCAVPDGFVMAYETDDRKRVPFSIKFARSSDLLAWVREEGVVFAPDRYAACPALRYVDGWFYMLYLEHRKPSWWFETYVTRSRDLHVWEPSRRNPVIAPEEGEDINTSDPDIVEFGGRTLLYYSIGDQRTYTRLKRAVFDGSLAEFFGSYYADDGSSSRTS
ncbi:hypothetical protein FJZ36_10710 [Candidatus Poribacteria bacterium]|nr:hypothetical protein [Candidatus Poribacteria bacterium]